MEKMKTKKQWLFLFLFAVALFLGGCQMQSKPVTESASIPTIKIVAYKKMDAEIPDEKLVMDKINEYIEPLLHVRVDVTFLPSSSYSGKLKQLLDSSEQMDLFFSSSGNMIEQLYKDGKLAVLNTLLEEYAPDIIPSIGEEYMKGGYDSKSQEYYGITTCRDYSLRSGIEYRSDIAQQYGIDMEEVHALSDLTAVFSTLKEKDPSLYPMAPNAIYRHWDSLGDGLGVLMYDRMDTTVVNLYETPEYREYISLIREWNEKGYLYDTMSNQGTNAYYLRSGCVFCCFANGKPGFVVQENRDLNCPIGFVSLEEDYISTDRISGWMWAIPNDAEYKKEAIQFLNLLYSDEEVINLWLYGIEGIHYQVVDEEKKTIGFPQGVNANNSGYPMFIEYAGGNLYLSDIWEGNPVTIWEEMKTFNNQAIRSRAFGFQYDDSRVKSEIVACNAVVGKYKNGFTYGIYDIDTVLPEFIQELKKAGIDKIIEEKQQQLDDWLASE